jgi:hypothetical protein
MQRAHRWIIGLGIVHVVLLSMIAVACWPLVQAHFPEGWLWRTRPATFRPLQPGQFLTVYVSPALTGAVACQLSQTPFIAYQHPLWMLWWYPDARTVSMVTGWYNPAHAPGRTGYCEGYVHARTLSSRL